MKYIATIYTEDMDPGAAETQEARQMMSAYREFGQAAADVIVGGEALQPSSTATTIRVRDGEPLFTDGPYAETREQLGGFYLLECENLDEALRWAAKIPGAQNGAVEVRPCMVFETAGAGAENGAAQA